MDTSIIFQQYDDNFAKVEVTAPTKESQTKIINYIYKRFRYENEKVKHTWAFKEGFHDGNSYVFDKKKGILPIGLIPKAVNYIKEKYQNIKIGVDDNIRKMYSNPKGTLTQDKLEKYVETLKLYNPKKKKPIIPFKHQLDICISAINGRRVSIMACTSSGKSLSIMIIGRYLMEVEKKKVLVITPSATLVKQLRNNFVDDYDWKEADEYCTLIYGESKDKLSSKQKDKLKDLGLGEEVMHKDFVISTWQSLQPKLPSSLCASCKKLKTKNKRAIKNCPDCATHTKKAKKFFSSFDTVIVDEAHSTRGEQLRDILSQCVNANNFKVGMSGTLPDEGLDAAYIEGSLGRKEVVIKLWQLIEMGILPPVQVLAIKIPYSEKDRKYLCRQNFDDEYYLLTNNGSRKKVIEMLIKGKSLPKDQNTLILFKKKETLDDMMDFLSEKFPEFTYHVVKGEVSVKKREQIQDQLINDTGHIIIATYGTMRQGVNIELLHNVVFAEFSKSMYWIVQSIGRVARAHPDKKLSKVFDIWDDASYLTRPRYGGMPRLRLNYSSDHFNERNGYYKDEKLPVKEYSLEGIYEGTIDPEALLEKKEKRKEVAAKKDAKGTIVNLDPQFD